MDIRENLLSTIAKTMPCTCDKAYKDRGLTAPDCAYCHHAEDIVDAILALPEIKEGLELGTRMDTVYYCPQGRPMKTLIIFFICVAIFFFVGIHVEDWLSKPKFEVRDNSIKNAPGTITYEPRIAGGQWVIQDGSAIGYLLDGNMVIENNVIYQGK